MTPRRHAGFRGRSRTGQPPQLSVRDLRSDERRTLAILGLPTAALAVALAGPFASTEGYAAMWLVCGGAILLSIPFLHALRRRSET